MFGVCRFGDIGIGTCPCHEHPVTYATMMMGCCASVTTNSLPTATMLTIGLSTCGHPTVAITASPNVSATSLGLHRMLDMGMNCGPYVMVSGSPNVVANY